MKLVIAYIQPEKLTDVKQALYAADVFKISVTNAMGCGQQKGYHETYRGVDVEVNLLKKTRLEIAVNADFVQPTIDAIVKGARTVRFSYYRWNAACVSAPAKKAMTPSDRNRSSSQQHRKTERKAH